jgi:serine/threonine protein kinase
MSGFSVGQRPDFQRTSSLNGIGSTRTLQASPSPPSDVTRTSSSVFGPSSTQSMPSLPPLPDPKQLSEKIESTDSESVLAMSSEMPARPAQMGPSPHLNEPEQDSLSPMDDERDLPSPIARNLAIPEPDQDPPQIEHPAPPAPDIQQDAPQIAHPAPDIQQDAPQIAHPAPPPVPQMSDLLSDGLKDAHFQVANAVMTAAKNTDISLFLANNLLPSLEGVRDADSGFGRQAKINTALDSSEEAARLLMRSIGSNSDVSYLLKGKSQAEIKTIVTDSMQKMMGYSDREMAHLSDKKKAWVDRTVAGIQAGMRRQPPGPTKGSIAQSLDQLEVASRTSFQNLGNLHPLSIQCMGQSAAEMQQALISTLGHNPPEIAAAIQRGVNGAFGSVNFDRDTMQITSVRHGGVDYNVVKELGRGQCGAVMLIEGPAPDSRKFALKPLDADPRAVNELQIQIRAAGDSSLQIAGVLKEGNQVFAMIELAGGGEMMNNLNFMKTSVADGHLSQAEAQTINLRLGAGAAQALSDFHSKGMVHRDIKPQNFFVTETGSTKLGDMGEALPDTTGYTEILGTPDYLAPEVNEVGRVASQPADNWALGIMLHEMLRGSHPFDAAVPGRNDPSVATQTALNATRFANGEPLLKVDGSTFAVDFSTYPDPLNTLFQGLLNPNPDLRMTAAQAHGILAQMDDPEVQIGPKLEAARDYGKLQEKIGETVDTLVEQRMAELHPNIPHIGQITRDLARYELALHNYSDPTERQRLIAEEGKTVRQLDAFLIEAQRDVLKWQTHQNEYNQAKQDMMPAIMLMDPVTALTDQVPGLVQQFN